MILNEIVSWREVNTNFVLATMTVGMGSTKVATLGNICNLTNTYNLKTIYQIIETDSI